MRYIAKASIYESHAVLRDWGESESRYTPTRLGTSAYRTSAEEDMVQTVGNVVKEGSSAVLTTGGPSQLE